MPFVYFIHEKSNNNCFKIGKTENHPADRMEQLQTGNPRKLVIYRWIQIPDHSTAEEYLHIRFKEYHIRGEWFNVTLDQIDEECSIIISTDDKVIVSGQWQAYTDEDRLKIREERHLRGTYRGKRNPRAAAAARERFIEHREMQKIINDFNSFES